jgi:hypothetical protein
MIKAMCLKLNYPHGEIEKLDRKAVMPINFQQQFLRCSSKCSQDNMINCRKEEVKVSFF